MDVPELAARILRGGGFGPQPTRGSSRRVEAIGKTAVLAQKEARREMQNQRNQAKTLKNQAKVLEQAKGRVEYLESIVKERPK